jgi:nitrogen fixation/metabolism regulation signal transduction histidine kinase
MNDDDSRFGAGGPEPAPLPRRSRWAWIVSTLAALGAGLVLAFLLGIATSNPALYERHYVWLFWVNVALASTLVAVIVVAGVRLLWRVSRGRFGSRLLLKLASIFALVGILPGLLIYAVSYQFVSRSIETWFDVKVEGALDAGLNLGRGTIDAIVTDLATKTRLAAERLGESASSAEPLSLERLREQLSAREIAVVGGSGQTLLATGSTTSGLMPERVPPQMLRQARTQRVVSQAEGLDEEGSAAATAASGAAARVRAVAVIPSSNFALDEQERFLVVTQSIAPGLASNALAVTNAYREYQQRALARSGLRKMYIGTLTLALVLAVFGALLLAIALSNQLAQPLLLLAEGVARVARGDFSSRAVFKSRDELGGLTRSFAEMTTQLADARELVQKSVVQVEGARANLQTILDNLTAGVIVFDRNGAIDTVNPGATRILKLPLSAYKGRRLDEVAGLGGFAQAVWQRFELHAESPEAGERDHWQDSFDLQFTTTPDGRERDSITLLVRGAAMPQGARLMVFDDITELVSAQRVEAWSEVARRLAHEIKNPLTPIQLSAERLQQKLGGKLAGADLGMLERSVTTIVNQVQAMKTLVNEFRDYARLPASSFDALDVNALVVEVLGLYGTAQESGRLSAELADSLPAIVGDGTQLRQVIHNLVQNALDAVAEQADGRVRIVTEAAKNESGEVRAVRLVVVDNGPGFSEKVLKRAFEPYVTTKKKGTGLGLAVVKKIADEHGARIRIANLGASPDAAGDAVPGGVRGAQVSLSFSKLATTVRVAANEPVVTSRAH